MNIPDHISENLEQFFGLKKLKFFDAGQESFFVPVPGSGIWIRNRKFESGIRDKHPRSAALTTTLKV
jgi:hypothetical protein